MIHYIREKLLNNQKAVLCCAVFWFSVCFSKAYAKTTDSTFIELPDVIVIQPGKSPVNKDGYGNVGIHIKDLTRLSRSFGEIDVVQQIRTLPGTYSFSDYGSGISVDGTDPSQSQYLIDGAPVIFPFRFGGIFTTFNAPHFSAMTFSRQSGADIAPRLGSSYSLVSANRFESGVEGSVNVATTSTSATVRTGIADQLAVSMSARLSYINQVYGKFLDRSDVGLKFAFNDLNLSATYRISASDRLIATFFQSTDEVSCADNSYSLNTYLHWKNTVYNIGYSHYGNIRFNANIYHSSFANTLSLTMPQMSLNGPSSIDATGLGIKIEGPVEEGRLSEWNTGINLIYNTTVPQWISFGMSGIAYPIFSKSRHLGQQIVTADIFVGGSIWLNPEKIKLSTEGAFGLFISNTTGIQRYTKPIITPKMSLTAYHADGNINLSCGLHTQGLHQVGFSELGLASNFWIGAFNMAPLQHSVSFTVSTLQRLPFGGLSIDAGGYYSIVKNQVEYQGQVLGALNSDYNPFTQLTISDGCNYGAFVSLSRQFGVVTGDINFSYGEGQRHTPENSSISWNALNSEGFSLKASAQWHLGEHWQLSASFRASSGRRYTPVEAIYMIGGNIAMEYGVRNSARLPSYQRLDIGSTYTFRTGRIKNLHHHLNFSLLNAYGHKNVEMQFFVLDSAHSEYGVKRYYSLYRFLPSFSYMIEF